MAVPAMPEISKPFAVYAITAHGIDIGARLKKHLPDCDLFVSTKLLPQAPSGCLELPLPMGPKLAKTFTDYDCHIFVVSVGAVVRMIAPLIRDKKIDPAVVCVDDGARWSICLLSGHVGRGNLFTSRVAEILKAQAVITTASDVLGTLTVDILGRELGWTLDDPERNVTKGCAAVVNGRPVMFVQEAGEPHWWDEDKPLPPQVRYTDSLDKVDPDQYDILLIVSDRDIASSHPQHFKNAVVYRPKTLVLGLGCDSGTSAELIERGVRQVLEENQLSKSSVKQIATIDIKKDEPALLALSAKFNWPLLVYPADRLDVVAGIENPSETVKKYTGTRAVAEPAALLASGAPRLLVPKTRYTEQGAGRSMTIAVARVPHKRREVANV